METYLNDKRTEIPSEVTIDCLELLSYCSKKDVAQDTNKVDLQYVSHFDGYGTSYIVKSDYEEMFEPANIHNGDRGLETISEAYDYDSITDIIEVIKSNEDGKETIIEIDEYTERELLNLIIIED